MAEAEKSENPNEKPLESWKEIAAYLKRDVRTVIRWEKSEGLPVHRHLHQARSSVYASPVELDTWWAARSPRLGRAVPLSLAGRLLPRLALAVVLLFSLSTLGDHSPSVVQAEPQRQGPSLNEIFTEPFPLNPGGRFSPDGKFYSTIDWDTGNLVVKDLEAEKVTPLTDTDWFKRPGGFAEFPAWSPDGQRIAYGWFPERPKGSAELRLVSPAGGPPQVLYRFKEKESFFPQDWSPDGKLIVGELLRADRKISLTTISTSGAREDLRVLDRSVISGSVRLSPEGRWLAYDASADGKQSLFLLAMGTKTETRLSDFPAEDRFPTWSPDGRFLLFVSNRTGRWDLWAMPMRDGQSAGEAHVVYPDIGQLDSILGWQKEGLVVTKRTSFGQLYAVEVDSSSGAVLGQPQLPVPHYLGQHMEALWSPDGKRLALMASTIKKGALFIFTAASGEIREIEKGRLTWFRLAGWLPSGDTLALSAITTDGKSGIYLIRAAGGPPEPLYEDPRLRWFTGRLSRDGNLVAYSRRSEPEREDNDLVVFDLKRKKTVRVVNNAGSIPTRFSPDGRAIYYTEFLPEQNLSRIVRVPLPGGEPQEVLVEKSARINSVAVSPDGAVLTYTKVARFPERPASTSEPRYELFVVSSSGGEAKRVPLPKEHNPWRVSWSADGKRICYVSWQGKHQFLRLSNFLSKAD